MRKLRSCVLLVTLVASAHLSYTAAAFSEKTNSRKLLQPFNLGLGRGDRAKANAGYTREGLINNLANLGIALQLDRE